MADQSIAEALGIKYATLLAGFVGAVVSLSFVKRLSRGAMVTAVAIGTVTAGYLTPMFLTYFRLPQEVMAGAAFLTGLTAMNVIPGILRITTWFKNDPSLSISGVRKPEN